MEIITFDHKVYQDLSEKIERIADYVFKKAGTTATYAGNLAHERGAGRPAENKHPHAATVAQRTCHSLHDGAQQMPLSALRRRGVHLPAASLPARHKH